MTPETKIAIDTAAIGTGFGSWLALLPDVAAAFSIVWLGLRIWETDTVKKWTNRGT